MTSELKNLLFIDIETVSAERSFDQLKERLKPQWDRKAGFLRNEKELSNEELFTDRAAIYAEFGKIIVIALGFFHGRDGADPELRVKALSSHNEKELLTNFKSIIETEI